MDPNEKQKFRQMVEEIARELIRESSVEQEHPLAKSFSQSAKTLRTSPVEKATGTPFAEEASRAREAEPIIHPSSSANPTRAAKFLYIFNDSKAHEAYFDQFIQLKNAGIQYDLLFLDGMACAWLGTQRIECAGAGRTIAIDDCAPAPIEIPKEYDGIIVPEIDLDSAARIALGMKGTVKAEIIFSALILNKFVLVGEDASGLQRADRLTLRTVELPTVYRRKYLQYIQQLKELGIKFAAQAQLANWAIRLTERNPVPQAAKAQTQTQIAVKQQKIHESKLLATNEGLFFQGKLLSADWVKAQSDLAGIVLLVQKGTIVSPLARDLLKERGSRIQPAIQNANHAT